MMPTGRTSSTTRHSSPSIVVGSPKVIVAAASGAFAFAGAAPWVAARAGVSMPPRRPVRRNPRSLPAVQRYMSPPRTSEYCSDPGVIESVRTAIPCSPITFCETIDSTSSTRIRYCTGGVIASRARSSTSRADGCGGTSAPKVALPVTAPIEATIIRPTIGSRGFIARSPEMGLTRRPHPARARRAAAPANRRSGRRGSRSRAPPVPLGSAAP